MTLLRLATPDDRPALERVMKASARDLGSAFYDERQTASFVTHVAIVDDALVADGTYFVVESALREGDAPQIAACGGWSRRDKLFTGNEEAAGSVRLLDPNREPARVRAMFVSPSFARRGLGRLLLEACEDAARREGFRRAELMATLPGVPLYRVAGYVDLEPFDVVLPDGVPLPCLRMVKTLAPSA